MKFGFIPIEGGRFYAEFLEQVELGESLGFDSVWLEEHHGVKDHYWPSPLMGLAGAATRTRRLLLGTDVLILPFYHPVRVAEDAAMLDVMSGGRLILGAAIGYKPDEFALYQAPMQRRGARLEEAVTLIRQLWSGESVDFHGKYYEVEALQIEPRPCRPGGPPIWLGGWGELSLGRAARLGDAWLPGPTADLEKLLEARRIYHRQLAGCGVDPATRCSPLTRELIVAESDEEARRMAEKHLLISYRDEYGSGRWSHPLIRGSDFAPVDPFDAICRNRFLIGSPETVIRQIRTFQAAFDFDHLICRLYFPGLPHSFILDELRLLAREVIPAFAGGSDENQHRDR